MSTDRFLDAHLDIAASEGIRSVLPRRVARGNLKFHLNFMFRDIPFAGKSMLDIGGGSGFYSFYAAWMGASRVVCLEPELAGSSRGIYEKSKRALDNLQVSSVSLQPSTFQDFDPGTQTFDIVLLHNSINHLDEEACINLQHSIEARNKYRSIFRKLSRLANPAAKLIICDCSRYNFFSRLKIRNPLAPNIEWEKHQSPWYWSRLLAEYNFINPEIRWTSEALLRQVGRLLLGNRLASYFLQSHFCLVMDKK